MGKHIDKKYLYKGGIQIMDSNQFMEAYTQMMPIYYGFGFVCYILEAIACMKLFAKAGVTSWYAWVPILNTYWLTKIATGNGWLFLLILIPCAGSIIYLILLGIKLSKAFGCGGGMTALIILLEPIALLVLGFGDAQYQGPQ